MGYWDTDEYKTLKAARQQAYYALTRAASDCPSRMDQGAFWEYQDRVMQPLRDTLATKAAELEAYVSTNE